MNNIENSIFQSASKIMKNTNFTVSLSGYPATIAVCLVCTATVWIVGICSREKVEVRRLDLEEKKLTAEYSSKPRNEQAMQKPQKTRAEEMA